MKRSLWWRIFGQSLRDRKARLAVAILAAGLGETLLIGLLSTSTGVRERMGHALRRGATSFLVARTAEDGSSGEWTESEAEAAAERLRQRGAIAVHESAGRVDAASPPGRLAAASAIGHPSSFEIVSTELRTFSALHLRFGRAAGDGGAAWVVAMLSDGSAVGSAVQSGRSWSDPIHSLAGRTMKAFVLAQPYGVEADGVVFASPETFRTWVAPDSVVHRVRAVWPAVDPSGEWLQSIVAAAVPGASLQIPVEEGRAREVLLHRLEGLMWGISWIVLGGSVLALVSLFTLNVLDRQQEIGVLRALGGGRRVIVGLFLAEAAGVGILGGALGLGLGLTGAQMLSRRLFEQAAPAPAWLVPAALGVGLVTALAATLWPLRRALSLNPVSILRGD